MDNKEFKFNVFDGDKKNVPVFIEKENTNKPYLSYGQDNRFPNYLWDLYLRSALLQSIINGTADYVEGNEIIYNQLPSIQRLKDKANNDGETLDDIIKKITVDYLIFGGFAIQVIANKLGEINEIYWLDFRNIRLNKEGDKAYYSDDWVRHSNDFVIYDVYTPNTTKNSYVFYFNGHVSRGIYPIPRYNGALAAIETSTEISKFHLNSILNNFSGNFIINFNNGAPDEETQGKIEKQIRDKFAGAGNAGKFLTAFNESKDNAVTVERIQDDNFDKKYGVLRTDTYKEIFIAFRCQPQLFGFVIEGSLFNKEEYQQAFELYNKTVVVPIQRDITRTFDKVFKIDNSVTFDTFKLNGGNE